LDEVLGNILFSFFIAGILILGVSLYFYYHFLIRRAFIEMARKLGYRYYYRSYAIPQRFSFLSQHRRGRGRYAFNILVGQEEGGSHMLFDYTFSTGLGAEKKWHYSSFSAMRHGKTCSFLRIYPRSMLEVLGDIVGYDEAIFEDSPFTHRYAVYATDDSFAQEMVTQPLVDYLMRHPGMSLEVEPYWVALGASERLIPEEIPRRLRQVEKVRAMLPL
jgi:hypothetical protein